MKIHNPAPLLAVRALIQDANGKVLILKRATNDAYGDMWCLPGGKVDFGQTAEEAIVREVMEETSLECNSSVFLFYQDGLPQNTGDQHYLTLYFQCQVSGTIKLNHESTQYAWLGPNELGEYLIAFNNDEALLAYWNPSLK